MVLFNLEQEVPSPSITMVPVNHFATLAPELLEKILVRSAMPFVNRHSYASLRSETVLLRFCTHVFYHGSRKHLPRWPSWEEVKLC